MVLKTVNFHNILILSMIACLSACGHLNTNSQNNRSPNKPVVPVENQTVLFPSQPAPEEAAITDPNQTSTDTQTPNNELSKIPNRKRLKPADVFGSIIDSVKKAIDGEEWLRAQRHLEHALRIEPKDAQAFYLYALVYEGLGINAQAINMLKRAQFLAQPNSDIYQLAQDKLAEISP